MDIRKILRHSEKEKKNQVKKEFLFTKQPVARKQSYLVLGENRVGKRGKKKKTTPVKRLSISTIPGHSEKNHIANHHFENK